MRARGIENPAAVKGEPASWCGHEAGHPCPALLRSPSEWNCCHLTPAFCLHVYSLVPATTWSQTGKGMLGIVFPAQLS